MIKWFAALLSAFAVLCVVSPAYAARYWVSNELTDVTDADKASVASPHPVQIIFEFKTNGAANARATNFLKAKITDMIRASGAFSEVSDAPVANGAILAITINDLGDVQQASSQGFLTGLTFGLHGTAVADNYEATSEYVSSTGAPTISETAHHMLITTLGNTAEPTNATRVAKANDAVLTVMRQLVTHLVNDTAKDPGFTGVATSPAVAATPVATTPAESVPAASAPATEPASAAAH